MIKALRSWYFWIWILSLIVLVVLGLYTTRNQSINGCVECKSQSGNHFYYYTCNGTEYPISKNVWVSLTSPECNGINSITSVSVNGLKLSLSLNSTTFQPGQEVSIAIDEQNTLPLANNVSSSQNWLLNGLSLGPCGTINYPFGISILQGYYDVKNVTSITPLQIYNTFIAWNCPAILGGIISYDFQSSSDIAAIHTSDGSESLSGNMNFEVTPSGFWTGGNFGNFSPGIYTIVGGDEWGAVVILHFSVS